MCWGVRGARWPSGLEHWNGNWVVLGSNPAAATSLQNFGNSFYPLSQCLSEETVKAIGTFYLDVSMPGDD